MGNSREESEIRRFKQFEEHRQAETLQGHPSGNRRLVTSGLQVKLADEASRASRNASVFFGSIWR
jgi:hypothetical protein